MEEVKKEDDGEPDKINPCFIITSKHARALEWEKKNITFL